LALLLAFILALGACSGDSDAKDAAVTSTTAQAETTTPTSTATTATTEDPKVAVLAAYRAFWADVVAAGKTAPTGGPLAWLGTPPARSWPGFALCGNLR